MSKNKSTETRTPISIELAGRTYAGIMIVRNARIGGKPKLSLAVEYQGKEEQQAFHWDRDPESRKDMARMAEAILIQMVAAAK